MVQRITPFGFFKEILRRHFVVVALNVVVLIFTGLVESGSVVTLAPIIDIFQDPEMKNASKVTVFLVEWFNHFGIPIKISSFIAFFLALIVLKNIFLLASRYMMLQVKYTIMRTMLVESFDSIFKSNWHFFTSTKQGELLNTFNKELLGVGDMVHTTTYLFSLAVRFLFFFLTPFLIAPKLILMVVGMLSVVYLPSLLIGKLGYRLGKRVTDTANVFNVMMQEMIESAKVILGFGSGKQAIKNVDKTYEEHKNILIKFQCITHINNAIYEPLMLGILFIAMFIAQDYLGKSISEILVIIYALRSAFPLFSQLVVDKNVIHGLIPSFEQMVKVMDKAKGYVQIVGEKSFKGFKKIIFKDVGFSYLPEKPVLKHVNLEIQKGSMVGLVGKSGSGKSTLIDLLMEFFEPTEGKILIDELDLKDVNIYEYRQKIGYVPQESVLFNLSIKDNLLWVKPNATDDEIKRVLDLAHASEFISEFPEGINTIVGDRGGNLSGGQRQRIALARAMLRKPEILILDEATSALDSESEKLIQEAINEIAKETTIVLIAHRLSTLSKADVIYVFQEGKVVESGSYQSLLSKKGAFGELAQLQGISQ